MRILGYFIVALITLACVSESVCEWVESGDHCDETTVCSLCLHSVVLSQPAPALHINHPVIYTVALEVTTPRSLQRPPLTPPPRV